MFLVLVFLGNLFVWPSVSTAEESRPQVRPAEWEVLPFGRPFPTLPTDPRDLKIGIRRNTLRQIEADIGGYRSLAGYTHNVRGETLALHIGVEGNAYFVLTQEGQKFPLNSSDGLLGIYGDAAWKDWQAQVRFTHLSAHLGDGVNPPRTRIPFSRETASLRIAKYFSFIRAYLGYHYLIHTEPLLPRHSLQVGAFAIFPVTLGAHLHPYLGWDFEWRDPTQGNLLTISLGLALLSTEKSPPLRFALNYLKGNDPRGQFFQQKIRYWTYGVELDF